MKISPARTTAFRFLERIEKDRAFTSALFASGLTDLSAADRGLCHELTLGVLRTRVFLDRLIDLLAAGRKLDREVRQILRLAFYQLRFLDRLPPHAVINEAVNMVVAARKTSAKGFVNAILRRSTREPVNLEFTSELERISVESSHPQWLIENWIGQFGIERTDAIARANNLSPVVSFRPTARTTDGVMTALAREADPGFLRELAAAGKIYLQDRGSQLVGNQVELAAGDMFLDVCAAPGSKTTQIAVRFPTARIIAGELNSARAETLAANCQRQGVGNVSVVRLDATAELPFPDETFAAVLVDAPCSGTGTIRHNPELRYFIDPEDFVSLAAKQRDILRNASKMVTPGGCLIYSTCSLERTENEGVVQGFIADAPEFRLIEPRVEPRFRTAEGFARVFPDTIDSDGFFIAMFEKTAKSGNL